MENIRKHWKSDIDIMDRFCIYFFESYTEYFDLCFHFSNLKIQIFYSTCTNSIDDFFNWMKQIDEHRNSIELRIDEEGPLSIIRLIKIEDNTYELTIERDKQFVLKINISIITFFTKLIYALNKLTSEKNWGVNNYYGNKFREKIKLYIEKYKINEYKECKKCKYRNCE